MCHVGALPIRIRLQGMLSYSYTRTLGKRCCNYSAFYSSKTFQGQDVGGRDLAEVQRLGG